MGREVGECVCGCLAAGRLLSARDALSVCGEEESSLLGKSAPSSGYEVPEKNCASAMDY